MALAVVLGTGVDVDSLTAIGLEDDAVEGLAVELWRGVAVAEVDLFVGVGVGGTPVGEAVGDALAVGEALAVAVGVGLAGEVPF